MKRVAIAALALISLMAPIAPAYGAASWTVAQLFEALSRERPLRATFQEKKYVSLLDWPVESSGDLIFVPPARLEKRTRVPREESVVIDGDRLTLERNGKRVSLALSEQPAIGALVESIRATLSGDLPSLERAYSLTLKGTRQEWLLALRPREAAVSRLVTRIEIAGVEAQVRTVEVLQVDGDRSVMAVTPVN